MQINISDGGALALLGAGGLVAAAVFAPDAFSTFITGMQDLIAGLTP